MCPDFMRGRDRQALENLVSEKSSHFNNVHLALRYLTNFKSVILLVARK
jgi:hypothetical protein